VSARRSTLIVLALLAALSISGGVESLAARGGLDRVVERLSASVVPVRFTLRPLEAPPGGEGQKIEDVVCGVIVGEDGLIVVSGDPFPDPGGDPRATLIPLDFRVLGGDDVEYPATVLGMNRDLNLAYLQFEGGLPEGYRAVEFDRDPAPRIGQEILILGLLPERYDFAGTFWTGRISAHLEEPRTMWAVTTFVQDLSIGGLAITPEGKPLGLVAEDVLPAGVSGGQSANPLTLFGSLAQGPRVGYPMIFPYAVFEEDLESPPPVVLEPRRAWFGITMQPLNRELRDYWEIRNPGGIIVTSVLQDSPAQGAGLHPGDVILELGDTTVTARELPDLTVFRQRVEKLPIGEEVDLAVWRGGDQLALKLYPGMAPRTGFLALEYEDEDFGLTVREITVDVIQAANLPQDLQGVVISDLESAGWAQVGGLGVGDIILRIDENRITDLDSFREALDDARARATSEAYFFIQRNVETRFVTVRTDW
jgi:S1-C subfamily serine protease